MKMVKSWGLTYRNREHRPKNGFTLIEISIVLVIIGLVVGGILVGQSLISAAGVRATISQIERYNTAANTFRGKYGYLPGDIKDPDASNFGFAARGQYAGQGDGNGLLQGNPGNSPETVDGFVLITGEIGMFWVDLSTVHLIDQTFNTANPVINIEDQSGSAIAYYTPTAKLGNGLYVYVYSYNAINYFALSGLTSLGQINEVSVPGVTVAQAAMIDKKVDDGLPQTGNITAQYLNWGTNWLNPSWAAGGSLGIVNGVLAGGAVGTSDTSATAPSVTTCYDNGNVAGATQQYSVEISNGSNVNCALSFKMQAGD
jgi:prepilin-type N-terminal cleavage/methylation domain-containing protein